MQNDKEIVLRTWSSKTSDKSEIIKHWLDLSLVPVTYDFFEFRRNSGVTFGFQSS